MIRSTLVATTSWAESTPSVSLECENYCDFEGSPGCNGMCLTNSVLGRNGAFRAPGTGDIGSPGWTQNPAPRILRLTCDESGVWLECRVSAGCSYRLLRTPSLALGTWSELQVVTSYDTTMWLIDDTAGSEPAGFYRLEEAK